jgi:L-fuconolactonase
MKSISIIDTHVHFWDPATLKYDWLESAGAQNQPFLLTDYQKATEGIQSNCMY